jgi:hypothetical protein
MHPALPWFFCHLLDEWIPGQRQSVECAYLQVYAQYGGLPSRLFPKRAKLVQELLKDEEPNLMYAFLLASATCDWATVNDVLHALFHLFELNGRLTEWERLLEGVSLQIKKQHPPTKDLERLTRTLLGSARQSQRNGANSMKPNLFTPTY